MSILKRANLRKLGFLLRQPCTKLIVRFALITNVVDAVVEKSLFCSVCRGDIVIVYVGRLATPLRRCFFKIFSKVPGVDKNINSFSNPYRRHVGLLTKAVNLVRAADD